MNTIYVTNKQAGQGHLGNLWGQGQMKYVGTTYIADMAK